MDSGQIEFGWMVFNCQKFIKTTVHLLSPDARSPFFSVGYIFFLTRPKIPFLLFCLLYLFVALFANSTNEREKKIATKIQLQLHSFSLLLIHLKNIVFAFAKSLTICWCFDCCCCSCAFMHTFFHSIIFIAVCLCVSVNDAHFTQRISFPFLLLSLVLSIR